MERTSEVHKKSSSLGMPKIPCDTEQKRTNGCREQVDHDSFPGKQSRLILVEMGSSTKPPTRFPRRDQPRWPGTEPTIRTLSDRDAVARRRSRVPGGQSLVDLDTRRFPSPRWQHALLHG